MANIELMDELYEIIVSRKKDDPKKSYVAKLFRKGRGHIAKKFGEEAVETVIEAVRDEKRLATEESADTLFHLLVLWADMGIKPSDVMDELEKRKGISGIEEKKSRKD